MAFTRTVTKISKDPDGHVRIQFGKREYDFESIEQCRQFAQGTLNAETLDAIAVALMLTRQPNLTNPSVFEGHSVTVDFSLNNWGVLS